ncbi:hypothetical protein NsoK4_03490 [Nitrosopumilus sp. K4]|uniref:hypothetical protein n=1 Tax=Nitrosopumilus sp. K4 TaxID=2795383 RepID=UPI001BACA23F|nr:hypothetical protein [Nitrosopumilus sp. K4]QUC65321.1 hypothetical protein NsoK4_03490 [Nitrosopumilus sp. K4]
MEVIEIVGVVSALGVIGALVFNGITNLRDKKSRHYEIFQDLMKEYTQIQEVIPDIVKIASLDRAELKKQPETLQNKVRMYRWKFVQFHEKIAHLALTGIIPKEITQFFNETFPDAIKHIELSPNPEYIKELSPNLFNWCEQEKIKTK